MIIDGTRPFGIEAKDWKANASLTMRDVIEKTAHNFPDPRFWPHVLLETPRYIISETKSAPHGATSTTEGGGTKAEFAERLFDLTGNPNVFETAAFDSVAMATADDERFGLITISITNALDVNTANNPTVIAALARGLKNACDEGHFALASGETAELGYRTAGYGLQRINWNVTTVSLAVADKLLLGDRLNPGQPVVAIRELSLRSNGYSLAREILETGHLLQLGYHSKKGYISQMLTSYGFTGNPEELIPKLNDLLGHDILEHTLLPWHYTFPAVTKQLLMPSRLMSPLMYELQGGVDGPRKADMIAAAHITGGGVPEKAKRMTEIKGLGAALDQVFPLPIAMQSLMDLVKTFPSDIQEKLHVTDRTVAGQWNSGIMFLIVAADKKAAQTIIDTAADLHYEAAVAGEIIDRPQIQFAGDKWDYEPAPVK